MVVNNAFQEINDASWDMYLKLRERLLCKVIAVYKEGIQDPVNGPTYIVDVLPLSKRTKELADEIKLSMGSGEAVEEGIQKLAYRIALDELRDDTKPMFRRMELTAGINRAIASGIGLDIKKSLETISYYAKMATKSEDLQLIPVEEGELVKGGSPEMSKEEGMIIIEDIPTIIEGEAKNIYQLLGLKDVKPESDAFKDDMVMLEQIIEGTVEEFATMRIDNLERLKTEARAAFHNTPEIDDYVVNSLIGRLERGLDENIKASLTEREFKKLGEKILTLKGNYNRYLKLFRVSLELSKLSNALNSAAGNYASLVVKPELELPLFLTDLANLLKLAPKQVIGISEQAEAMTAHSQKEAKAFYEKYIRSREVAELVNGKIQFMQDIPRDEGSMISPDEYKGLAEGAMSAVLPELRNAIADPFSRKEVYSIDPKLKELIQKGLLENPKYPDLQKAEVSLKEGKDGIKRAEEMHEAAQKLLEKDKSSQRGIQYEAAANSLEKKSKAEIDEAITTIERNLTDNILMGLIGSSENLQENIIAMFTSIAEEVSSSISKGTAGKAPFKLYMETLFKEASLPCDDLKPRERFLRWLAAYKTLKLIFYPDLGQTVFYNLEKKLIPLAHGVHPDSHIFDAEKEFFMRRMGADDKTYEKNRQKMDVRFAKEIIKMMNLVYDALEKNAETLSGQKKDPLDVYLSGLESTEKRIPTERRVAHFIDGTIHQYLKSLQSVEKIIENLGEDPGLNDFFSGVNDRFLYLIRASHNAREVLLPERQKERTKLARESSYKESGKDVGLITQLITGEEIKLRFLDRVYAEINPVK